MNLFFAAIPAYIWVVGASRLWRYTDFVISHSDPGAVPGASTRDQYRTSASERLRDRQADWSVAGAK